MNPLIESYAEEQHGERGGALTHSKRVYLLAKQLSDEYDEVVLHAACYLHDINMDKPHPKKAAEQAEKFLKSIDFHAEKIPLVVHAIEEHGYYGNPDSKEGFMLFDADQLESMGVTGYGQYSEFSPVPDEMERVLTSIEKEAFSILKLSKSKELAKKKIENRKKIIEMMREELGYSEKGL